jgi:hypothetical protein
MGTVLDVGGVGSVRRRRVRSPLAEACKRVRRSLPTVASADQSSSPASQLLDDHQDVGVFSLHDALVREISYQGAILGERAAAADRFFAHNPEKVRQAERVTGNLLEFSWWVNHNDDDIELYHDHMRAIILLSHDPSPLIYRYPVRLYLAAGLRLSGVFDARNEAFAIAMQQGIAMAISELDHDSMGPYVDFLIQLARVLELEILAVPYL